MKKDEKQENTKSKRLENLRPQKAGEPSHNPNGRPKGALNRSTLIKKFFESNLKTENPLTGKHENLSMGEHAVLSMLHESIKNGNVQATQFIFDSLYGKIVDKLQTENKTDLDLNLSPEEARSIINKLGNE
jgi:hypothetical protein